uniref:Uncharacterized protein n=2 Tax=Caenorhabditis japonica TaxID=281687 RepID=A0A8R1ED69_CAEJA
MYRKAIRGIKQKKAWNRGFHEGREIATFATQSYPPPMTQRSRSNLTPASAPTTPGREGGGGGGGGATKSGAKSVRANAIEFLTKIDEHIIANTIEHVIDTENSIRAIMEDEETSRNDDADDMSDSSSD